MNDLEFNESELEYVPLKVTSGVLIHIGAGIYNSVAGAIKELVSNSYDADATNVSISMDYPYFNKIKVVDDGIGMSGERLRKAMQMIGSSLKSLEGSTRTEKFDRPIIGHLGIGLMALSQICKKARIESKVSGSSNKLIAELDFTQFKTQEDIQMNLAKLDLLTERYGGIEYIEEILDDPTIDEDFRIEVETDYKIADYAKKRLKEIREKQGREKQEGVDLQGEHLGYCIFHPNIPAPKKDHGTTITLMEIDDEVKNQLLDGDKDIRNLPEKYWDQNDPYKIYRHDIDNWSWRELCNRLQCGTSDLRYSDLPYYHQFLWELAIMTPIEYFSDGPLMIDENILNGKKKELIENNFNLTVEKHKLKKPILLPSGKLVSEIDKIRKGVDYEIREINFDGNEDERPLKFHGYIYWQKSQNMPNMVQGLQIYIRNVGIGLYDRTMLNYDKKNPGSRIPQISGEVYVEEGLENALSVDRNSFRETDPHYSRLKTHIYDVIGSYKGKGSGLFGVSVQAYNKRKETKDKKTIEDHIIDLENTIVETSSKAIQIKLDNSKDASEPFSLKKDKLIIYTQFNDWPRALKERLFSQKVLIPVKIAVDNGASAQEILDLLKGILLK